LQVMLLILRDGQKVDLIVNVTILSLGKYLNIKAAIQFHSTKKFALSLTALSRKEHLYSILSDVYFIRLSGLIHF
ncbi:hypothetical protein SMA74_25890, partial [Escherichia coli]|uniref:hypothetical protein n=1 Tax=Escherichia coli TaxID=562 RepID=UPI00307A20CC